MKGLGGSSQPLPSATVAGVRLEPLDRIRFNYPEGWSTNVTSARRASANTPATTITRIATETIRITYRRCPGTAPC
jgi:hypothetical protein